MSCNFKTLVFIYFARYLHLILHFEAMEISTMTKCHVVNVHFYQDVTCTDKEGTTSSKFLQKDCHFNTFLQLMAHQEHGRG